MKTNLVFLVGINDLLNLIYPKETAKMATVSAPHEGWSIFMQVLWYQDGPSLRDVARLFLKTRFESQQSGRQPLSSNIIQ